MRLGVSVLNCFLSKILQIHEKYFAKVDACADRIGGDGIFVFFQFWRSDAGTFSRRGI